MSDTEIPVGFERHFRRSGLTDPWEPLYSRRTSEAFILVYARGLPMPTVEASYTGDCSQPLPTTRWDFRAGRRAAMLLPL
jgi:hypothetical protein